MDPSTQATIDEMLDTEFGGGFASAKGRPKVPVEQLIEEVGELDQSHALIAAEHVERGDPIGVKTPDLVNIRATHHRLAQFLSAGMEPIRAAKLCNYTPTYVGILMNNPAFQELLAFYKDTVDEEWGDFVSIAAGLGLNALQELQERMESDPKQFTVTALRELAQMTADRTGHAPVTKSVNINLNSNAADRLARARERVRDQTLIESGHNVQS